MECAGEKKKQNISKKEEMVKGCRRNLEGETTSVKKKRKGTRPEDAESAKNAQNAEEMLCGNFLRMKCQGILRDDVCRAMRVHAGDSYNISDYIVLA